MNRMIRCWGAGIITGASQTALGRAGELCVQPWTRRALTTETPGRVIVLRQLSV